MEAHAHLTDDHFEDLFRNGTLDPRLFSHEAHLRLAWIHLKKYGLEKAIEHVCCQIKAYDLKYGKGDKFHYTLTAASVKVVCHFMQKSNSGQFEELVKEYPRLKSHFNELIYSHYRPERIWSSGARTCELEPDLLPFN